MEELILGDQEAGEHGQRPVEAEVRRRRSEQERAGEAGQEHRGVQGVPHPLAAGQGPPAVEPELVHPHGEALEAERQEPEQQSVHPCFRRRAPEIVSPGPKARETIKVPGWTVPSSRMAFQTWGSVAEDMFPKSPRMVLLAWICSGRRPR